MKWQKIASYQKKITNKKILTDDQHCDASESRANFGIYIGSLKHPKLSAWTYGFSHVFYYKACIEISWVKMRLNMKFQFGLDV